MTRDLRRVEVDPERIAGWLDRFAARHGDLHVAAAGKPPGHGQVEDSADRGVQESPERALDGSPHRGGVVVRAPDGAEATLWMPWPPASLPPSSGERRAAGGDLLPRRLRERLTASGAELLAHLVGEAQRPRTVGLLLVRRGGYAVGVAAGTRLLDSKVGSRYVQGKTKAGGWSQQRYARRRQAQAQQAFAAAGDAAVRILLPRLAGSGGAARAEGAGADVLEVLVTGGDRAAVSSVLADSRLSRLADLPRGRFLAVPDPRQRVLEDAVRRSRAVAIDVFDAEYEAGRLR